MRRVIIQWTETAKQGLAKLPRKARRGLLDKAAGLRNVDDPTAVHKPLIGPLGGYYRITYARYRAIYKVDKETLPNEGMLVYIRVLFVAVGTRKEGDKNDIYRFAQRLLRLGVLERFSLPRSAF
jgi:mRNA-degrading endonuclease RelE of RelBE toxin-antitoxin system